MENNNNPDFNWVEFDPLLFEAGSNKFATHQLEQGTDLRYIQAWLGHDSNKTTEIYTHVSKKDFHKFKNPINDIEL